MNITIRKADQHDFSVILGLIQEFARFQRTPGKVTITLEQLLEEKDLFQCLIAETEDGQVAGFASFFFAYFSWTGKALYLDDLYVREAFRKHAIGKSLLDAVIALAKEQLCKKIRWQVSEWNSNAIAFYKRMGAVVDATEINCDLLLV